MFLYDKVILKIHSCFFKEVTLDVEIIVYTNQLEKNPPLLHREDVLYLAKYYSCLHMCYENQVLN